MNSLGKTRLRTADLTSILLAELTGNQAAVGLNTDIIWNSQVVKIGTNIALNIATGVFTLQPGTYELEAQLRAQSFSLSTGGFLTLGWVDSSNVAIQNSAAVLLPTTNTSGDATQSTAKTILVVTTQTDVKIRVTNNNGNAAIIALTSRAIIKKL